MAEFKIEVPIDVQGGGVGGGAVGGGSTGSSDIVGAIKKLDRTMFMNIDVLEILTQFFGDILKAVQPLIKILSLLLFMFFLPALPVIIQLTKWIAKLVSVMPKVWDFIIGGITDFVQTIIDKVSLIVDGVRAVINALVEGAVWIWEKLVWLGDKIAEGGRWVWDKLVWLGEQIGEGIRFIWEGLVAFATFFINVGVWIWEQIIKPAFDFLATIGEWIWDIIKTGLDFIVDLGSKIWDFIRNALSSIGDLGSKIWNYIENALSFIGDILGFASGGRPPVGVASVVGERGPELFVPDSSGTIIPNHKLSGGGGSVTINISGNSFNSESDMRKMVNMISRRLAQQSNRSFS